MIGKISPSGDLAAELRARAKQDPSLRGFAYTVPGLEDLGLALGDAIASNLEPGEIPHKIVVLPRQRVLQRAGRGQPWSPFPIWKRTHETILIHSSQRLLTAAILDGRRLELTSTPLKQIITLQLGTILLFSWFEWSWANAGKLETNRVYFNTVSDRIFRELQQCLSVMLVQIGGFTYIPKSPGFHHLENLPYKFRNIIPLRLLLPGEEIRAVIYRPGLWVPNFVFLKREISPASALVLTDRQILVAEEDLGGAEGHYGVIARYTPRSALKRAVLEQQRECMLLRMIFQIQGVEFEQRQQYEFSAKPQLDMLLTELGTQITLGKQPQ